MSNQLQACCQRPNPQLQRTGIRQRARDAGAAELLWVCTARDTLLRGR
jgi:hypothetical protein